MGYQVNIGAIYQDKDYKSISFRRKMITILRNFRLDMPQVKKTRQQVIDYIVLELRSELELTHMYRGQLKL